MPSGSSSSRHSCVVLLLSLSATISYSASACSVRDSPSAKRGSVSIRSALADRAHEGRPLCAGVDDAAHQAVLGRVRPPLGVEQAGIAEAAARRNEGVAVEMVAKHQLRGRLEHRHVDRLPTSRAFPREQRGADDAEGVQAGRAVREVDGRVARHVGSRPHAGLGDGHGRLDQVVEGGRRRIAAALAEAEGADVDHARVDLPHRLVVEPEPLHCLRAHVVDQRVGAFHELQQRFLAGGLLQIQDDAALVAVQVEEERTRPGAPARTGGAQHVAAGRLHLDHVGAEVRQHLRGGRAHDDFGDVDDPQARKWSAVARVACHSCCAPF